MAFSNAWTGKGKGKSLSRVRLFETPWTAAHQAPPSMGFSSQEYWSGVPLPSPNTVQVYHKKKKRKEKNLLIKKMKGSNIMYRRHEGCFNLSLMILQGYNSQQEKGRTAQGAFMKRCLPQTSSSSIWFRVCSPTAQYIQKSIKCSCEGNLNYHLLPVEDAPCLHNSSLVPRVAGLY